MKRKHKGSMIAELAVVLVILGFIFTFISPNISEILNSGKHSTAQSQASSISLAIQQYAFELNSYPDTLDDLTEKNGQFGPWITEDDLLDPWGNEYHYAVDEANGMISVWSYGKNGSNNSGNGNNFTGDDIGVKTTIVLY